MSQQNSDVLSQITEFLSRYLRCSEPQRAILALWVLHTYCASAAEVTPYLSIRSACKQSGKTLCLQLLSLLCEDSALTAGFTASKLAQFMKLKPASPVLLDECQATIGTRSRSKAPALRALLAAGFHRSLVYTTGAAEQPMFCPKAFAGLGQLPEELADRSIPIILDNCASDTRAIAAYQRLAPCLPGAGLQADVSEASAPSAAGQKAQRFRLRRATQQAQPLKQLLRAWAKENLPQLEDMQPYNEDNFPPDFSPRRQDLTEPLLQLADTLGGEWPVRARQALIALFRHEETFDLQTSLQLLADVHACFVYHGFPERLSTNTLLDWMHTLPVRPWDIDGPLSAYKLSRLLAAFDIRPRLQRIDKAGPIRGYQLHDFLEPWRRHLGVASPNWAAPAQTPDWASRLAEYENISKNGVCNGVAPSHAAFAPAEKNLDTQAEDYQRTEPQAVNRTRGDLWAGYVALQAGMATRQKLEANQAEIAGNEAGCNGVAPIGIISGSSNALESVEVPCQ